MDATAPAGFAKREILAEHEFFRGLPGKLLSGLAARARIARHDEGDTIFAKGDEGSGLLAVHRGRVKISALSAEGREVLLNVIRPGEVFGEIALLDGLPRTADATALEPCELVVLDRRDVLPFLMEEPMVAVKLLEVVSRRLRRTSEQVEALSFEPPSTRLAKLLLRLSASAADGAGRIAMTQTELGQGVGLSRESTNKHLRAWHEAGYVDLIRGGVVVRDGIALARASGVLTE